jgi:hypothetical protein
VQQSLIDAEETMNHTTALQNDSPSRLAVFAIAGLQRWIAWLRGNSSPARQHHTRYTAAMLYARAARYEATQPGFASDLRAAAESLEQAAAERAR